LPGSAVGTGSAHPLGIASTDDPGQSPTHGEEADTPGQSEVEPETQARFCTFPQQALQPGDALGVHRPQAADERDVMARTGWLQFGEQLMVEPHGTHSASRPDARKRSTIGAHDETIRS